MTLDARSAERATRGDYSKLYGTCACGRAGRLYRRDGAYHCGPCYGEPERAWATRRQGEIDAQQAKQAAQDSADQWWVETDAQQTVPAAPRAHTAKRGAHR